jgi:hypothetical protein
MRIADEDVVLVLAEIPHDPCAPRLLPWPSEHKRAAAFVIRFTTPTDSHS